MDRDRLSGQRRLVQHGARAGDDPIYRDDLAATDQDEISDRDRLYGDVLDMPFAPPVRDPRRAIDQRFEIALGARDSEILKHVAAGIHDRHHYARQSLAEQESGRHRYERDRINADAA